jgi:hypothetical protein
MPHRAAKLPSKDKRSTWTRIEFLGQDELEQPFAVSWLVGAFGPDRADVSLR